MSLNVQGMMIFRFGEVPTGYMPDDNSCIRCITEAFEYIIETICKVVLAIFPCCFETIPPVRPTIQLPANFETDAIKQAVRPYFEAFGTETANKLATVIAPFIAEQRPTVISLSKRPTLHTTRHLLNSRYACFETTRTIDLENNKLRLTHIPDMITIHSPVELPTRYFLTTSISEGLKELLPDQTPAKNSELTRAIIEQLGPIYRHKISISKALDNSLTVTVEDITKREFSIPL